MRPVVAQGAAAQVVVVRDGAVVLDRSVGVGPDVPFLLLSAGKPLVAVLVHQLAAEGALGLDDPLARHWPEFGARGKDRVTVRHVLQHRAGLPFVRSFALDALNAGSWRRSVRALERARPRTAPGEAPAYHVLTFGFLLGELVQRVTGRSLRDVLRNRILDPLGMRDTHLGTPRELWSRRVPLRGTALDVRQTLYNGRGLRERVIPAASVSSTARDLARFYQALLDGRGLLDAAGVAEACTPSNHGDVDRVLGAPVRWSQGFQLGGTDGDPAALRPMGRLSGRRTFGHNGSNACLGWADPERGLAVAYLTNRLQGGRGGSPQQSTVSDAILRAC